jgi:hypothetical protein
METLYGNIKTIASYLSIQDTINLAITNKLINYRLQSTLDKLKRTHLSRFAIDSEIEEIAKRLMKSGVRVIETNYGTFCLTKYTSGRSSVSAYLNFVENLDFLRCLDKLLEIKDYTGIDFFKNASREYALCYYGPRQMILYSNDLIGPDKEMQFWQYKIFVAYVRFIIHAKNMLQTSKWKSYFV